MDTESDIQIWDLNTKSLLDQIHLPNASRDVFSAVELNWPMFARNNSDGKAYWIELWNLDTIQMTRLDVQSGQNGSFNFSRDGSMFLALCEETLSFWNTKTGQLVYAQQDNTSPSVRISPDNRTLVIGHFGKVELWDISQIAQAIKQ
jgi:WD40 repeat protein